MKKMTSLLAIAAIMATGCNKEKAFTHSDKDKLIGSMADISYTDYGQVHNDALILTEYYWADGPHDNETLLTYMVDELNEEYPGEFSGITSTDIYDAVNSSEFQELLSVNEMTDAQATSYFRDLLGDMVTNSVISTAMYNVLYDAVDASTSYSELISGLNSVEISSFSQADQDVFNIYKSTLISSHDYWSDWYPSHPGNTYRQLTNSEKVMIVDAVAALGFFAAGPFGVAIAAVVSLGVNNE